MAATKPGLRAVTRVRAAIYCRISLAKLGETVKVDDQEKLGRKLAAQRDWDVVKVYTDNSKSAWQRNRKRIYWDQMLSDVANGLIDAIIVYHGDRLIRQPWDLEVLLRLADEKGILLASPTGERRLDSADDRFILRIEAAQACRESDNTSRRLKWYYEKAAKKGLVRRGGQGGRAFGLEADGVTVREEDKAIIQEAARLIIAGEDTGSVVRILNAKGARTTTGREFSHGTLKKMMTRPRMAGLVEHLGEIVGPAKWEPILDRDTWETVCAVLEDKASRFPNATGAHRYLLSGIAICSPCGEALSIRSNPVPARVGYGCVNESCVTKVYRGQMHLDAYVVDYVLGMLGNSETFQRLSPREDPTDWNAVVKKLERTRQLRIDEFADDDEADASIIRATVRRLDTRIAEARRKLAQAAIPDFLEEYRDLDLDGWEALGLDRQRALVGRTTVVAVKRGRRGPGFDPSTVDLTPRPRPAE